MAADLKEKAKEAFVDDNFDLAIDLYTQALDLDPRDADLLADRAQANIKVRGFTEAVADASRAIELNPSMAKAYFRKGTACMELEEYQTAKAALETGAALAPGDSRFARLIKECIDRIEEETRGLVPPAVLTPPVDVPQSIIPTKDTNDSMSPVGVASVKQKYRRDYYNTSTEVVLTIFAKGIPPKNVHVDFGEQILSVLIDLPGEEPYNFQPRLFAKIIPDKCRYTVLESKIEIRLVKTDTITWTSLEFSKDNVVPQKINVSSVSHRPTYPSSKSKVDWDKLEAQMKKEEKDEKLDGEAALNKLFCDIYRNADEDTRRAMKKSFQEDLNSRLQ